MKPSKHIWLVNIGEYLPIEGNRPLRMCTWKTQLEKEGHQVTFLTTDFEHQRKKWIKTAPQGFILLKSVIPYKKNISFLRLINHFLVAISLWRTIRQQHTKADIIIVSYPTIWLTFISVLYGKTNNIKVIVDIRDKWPDIFLVHPILNLFLWPLFLVKKYIFNQADQIITISPGYYHWALPNKKIKPESILPLVLPEVTKVKRKLNPENPVKLLFVGSLGTTYYLEMLLTIHDALQQKNIPFQIQVCGDGPRRAWLQEQIAERKQIELAGWLNKIEMQEKFNQANFGLMLYYPKSPQGWPNKLFEYMANGLPMLNTLKGEAWQLIEQEKLGINFQTHTIPTLIESLSQLIQNPESYNNLVQQNYITHKKTFSEQANYKKLLKLIP